MRVKIPKRQPCFIVLKVKKYLITYAGGSHIAYLCQHIYHSWAVSHYFKIIVWFIAENEFTAYKNNTKFVSAISINWKAFDFKKSLEEWVQ